MASTVQYGVFMISPDHKIVSFFMENVADEVLDYQRRVFHHFGYYIQQVFTTKTHALAIDEYLSSTSWQVISIFDIDCIPVQQNVLEEAFQICSDGNTIYGCAQQANHLLAPYIYVSPAFCNFSRVLYERLGKPSFVQTENADVGGELTKSCMKHNARIELLYPSSVEIPRWRLGENLMFGLGTEYENKIYHAFRIRRSDSGSRFIKRSKEILDSLEG